MICEPLAYTGSGVPLGLLLTIAIACVAAGGVLLLMTRRRGRVITVALLVLLCGAGMTITTSPPAQADGVADCPPVESSPTLGENTVTLGEGALTPGPNSLTVIQTSVMEGLAPGVAPVPIFGLVTNNGTDSTEIFEVEVEIIGVTTDPGAVPGTCDASDYILLDTRMPVGVTLAPGGSTEFAGASIGFNDKSTNQDACKGATIELLHTANPS